MSCRKRFERIEGRFENTREVSPRFCRFHAGSEKSKERGSNMKKTAMITTVLLLMTLVIPGIMKAEDLKFPRPSQGATVSQMVGLTKVTLSYHRPGVKERQIWGKLVPLDKVWRLGANEATTIEFNNDAKIEGQAIKAGKYALFAIPGKAEWTFIFNKQVKIWGTYEYKDSEDVLRVKVKPMKAPHSEWMALGFGKLTADSAMVYMHWEKVMVGFTIKFETDALVKKGIGKRMEGTYRDAYEAAKFAFDKEKFKKAKKFVKVSIAAKKTYWNMLLKAKIYKKLAKDKKGKKKAIEVLGKANSLIAELPENYKKYAKEGPKLYKEWSGKDWKPGKMKKKKK